MKWWQKPNHKHRYQLKKEDLDFRRHYYEFECLDCGDFRIEIRNPNRDYKVEV